MARALSLFFFSLILEVILGSPCHECNNQRGMAGCVAFENSNQNQCLELMCPEIHVETMTNPVAMTTQAFSVPKSCCSAPYCSIPAPRPPAPAIGPPIYTQTTCCTSAAPNPCTCGCGGGCGCKCGCVGGSGCKCGCGGACGCKCGCKCCQPQPPPLPPRPMPPPQCQPMPQCCMPYQMPMQPAAPSYCVQSVVVGGSKPDAQHREEGGASRTEEDITGTPGRGLPTPGGPRVGVDPVRGRAGADGGRAGIDPARVRAAVDPIRPRFGIRGGALAGFGGFLTGASRLPINGDDDTRRYETYLEKIMDVIKDRCEPDCCEPSPLVVMPQPQPRVRVRRIRRRKQRKYVVESCEDPDEIVEEEDCCEPAAPYVIAPCHCRHSYGSRRRRHFV